MPTAQGNAGTPRALRPDSAQVLGFPRIYNAWPQISTHAVPKPLHWGLARSVLGSRSMRGPSALLPLLVLGGLACQDTTRGLRPGPGPDAGAPDATVSNDAGPVSDAGLANLCVAPRTFSIRVSGFTGPVYEGLLAEVDSENEGELTFVDTSADGGEVSLSGEVPSALNEGLYWARLELYRPFWTEARLSLWRVGASGAPVDLALVAFSGGAFSQGEVDGVTYSSDAQLCIIEDRCGDSEALSLRVGVRGDEVVVPFSTSAGGPTYDIFNGASHQFLDDGPRCEDRPEASMEGWIALSGTRPGYCAAMPRDACIASPRCVLWGSENQDPGYVCQPVRSDCGRFVDDEVCARNPSCTWDPGDCYCPEGELCTCGGGSAPKCRNMCSGFGGSTCPPDLFCEDLSQHAPDTCAPPPERVGHCEWSPTTCTGAPNLEVCACGAAGFQTFENDCLRRAAGASGPTMGRCAP